MLWPGESISRNCKCKAEADFATDPKNFIMIQNDLEKTLSCRATSEPNDAAARTGNIDVELAGGLEIVGVAFGGEQW